jgi:hypothetical protein
VEQGEVTLQSYTRLCTPGAFSKELPEKILRGESAQKYAETVLQTAEAFLVALDVQFKRMKGLEGLRRSFDGCQGESRTRVSRGGRFTGRD